MRNRFYEGDHAQIAVEDGHWVHTWASKLGGPAANRAIGPDVLAPAPVSIECILVATVMLFYIFVEKAASFGMFFAEESIAIGGTSNARWLFTASAASRRMEAPSAQWGRGVASTHMWDGIGGRSST